MRHSVEMWRCLVDCDVVAIRKLWRHVAPKMPQPKSDVEALRNIHYARTQMPTMQFRLRAYSHAWLVNNNWPSALPDNMRPRAERSYPVIKPGVGIAMKTTSRMMRPAIPIIRGAMETAVMEAHVDGKIMDTPFVKARMQEARDRTTRKLFGSPNAIP